MGAQVADNEPGRARAAAAAAPSLFNSSPDTPRGFISGIDVDVGEGHAGPRRDRVPRPEATAAEEAKRPHPERHALRRSTSVS